MIGISRTGKGLNCIIEIDYFDFRLNYTDTSHSITRQLTQFELRIRHRFSFVHFIIHLKCIQRVIVDTILLRTNQYASGTQKMPFKVYFCGDYGCTIGFELNLNLSLHTYEYDFSKYSGLRIHLSNNHIASRSSHWFVPFQKTWI